MDTHTETTIRKKYELLDSIFDERTRRLWAADESQTLDSSGVSVVSRATDLSRTTIYQSIKGLAELGKPTSIDKNKRIRAAGGDANQSKCMMLSSDNLISKNRNEPSQSGKMTQKATGYTQKAPKSSVGWVEHRETHHDRIKRGQAHEVRSNTGRQRLNINGVIDCSDLSPNS